MKKQIKVQVIQECSINSRMFEKGYYELDEALGTMLINAGNAVKITMSDNDFQKLKSTSQDVFNFVKTVPVRIIQACSVDRQHFQKGVQDVEEWVAQVLINSGNAIELSVADAKKAETTKAAKTPNKTDMPTSDSDFKPNA